MTKEEQEGLDALKARMSETQRRDMAEIIQKEMERRGMTGSGSGGKKPQVQKSTISGALSTDQVKELYSDVGQAVQKLRLQKLEKQVAEAKMQGARAAASASSARPGIMARPRHAGKSGSAMSFTKPLLMVAVVSLGIAKLFFSTGAADDAFGGISSGPQAAEAAVQPPAPVAAEARSSASSVQRVEAAAVRENVVLSRPGVWSASEKELLTQLDTRRVELEKRREALDKREADIKAQAMALADRLAELRGLTAKLAESRKERDTRYETRLGQLANVYGAMEPSEAAQLVAKLDDSISLELLERMPEKRMGQVLSFMEKERAVELTRMLTQKRSVN